VTTLLLAWQVAAAMPLLEQGRFPEARLLLESACQARAANGCYLLGRTLFAMDLYNESLRTLSPLVATDPDPWRVRDALGSVYEALRRPADAEREFRASVRENQDRTPEPRYHLGRFLTREGRIAEAIAVLTPAADRFKNHQPVRFELGRALYQADRLAEAEMQLAAAPSLEEARRLLQKITREKRKEN